MTNAFPLSWPSYRPRRKPDQRKGGAFSKVDPSETRYRAYKAISIADALKRLQVEIDRLGASDYVLSSNLPQRLDGQPRSDVGQPADPGVALYFNLKGKPHCMPCDTFSRVEHNIAAIAAHIEATRKINRYGVADVAEMFTAFASLPPPKTWRELLGFPAGLMPSGRAVIDAAFRERSKKAHPDRPGGSHDAMAELSRARDEGIAEIEGLHKP